MEGISLITSFIADNQAPEITVAEPARLWPANHQFVGFNIEDMVTSVTDNSTEVQITDVYITSVSSDEPEDVPDGDGETLHDIIIGSNCQSVSLRAERIGNGNGRVYSIQLALDDGFGNTGIAVYQVEVPANQRKKGIAIDDDPAYMVESNCLNLAKINENSGNKEERVLNVPEGFALEQNYPNPFNPVTTIRFSIPETAPVTLRIFNTAGQLVRTLIQDNLKTGYHAIEWDGRSDEGHSVSSGIYRYKLQSGQFTQTRRMLLVK